MKHKMHYGLWFLMAAVLVACQPIATPAATLPVPQTTRTQAAGTAAATASLPPPAPTSMRIPSPTPDLSTLPALADLAPGWNMIDPGGSTSCAYGGKYSFFVRKANSDKLLIYFEGGGSCYDAKTCAQGGNYFDGSIDPAFEADNPGLKSTGVFALDDNRNPFKDYNIVFVTYCTGDAFLGNQVVTYQGSGSSFQIHHMGFENARMVLNWTYQNFARPESLFMIGCSAGVTGSYFNAPFILEHYQNVPATLVGDSGAGFIDGPASYVRNFGMFELLPDWIPQYQEMTDGDILRSKYLITIPTLAYPQARFGLLDTLGDAVQVEIINRFHLNSTLPRVIQSNLNEIRADAPSLVSFTGPGDHHCITMSPTYYDYHVGGVQLNDWFAELAAGRPVQNVAP